MADIEVTVFRGGKEVDRVSRPLRDLNGGPAVTYRQKLWPLIANSEIHLDQVSPLRSSTKAAASSPPPVALPKSKAGALIVVTDINIPAAKDDEQDRTAIRTAGSEARILVEAGPGTGKTELAARRIAGLVAGNLSPGQLLVLSFSRSAVRTLTLRLSRLTGCNEHVLEELRHVAIRTFDSWAFRMLRLMGKPPNELIYRTYDENIADLTALIRGKSREEVRARIGDRRHIIVDEFQDLPGVRAELVMALLDLLAPPNKPGCGFTVLGDPLQSIFGFAVKGQKFLKASEYWKTIAKTYGANLQLRTLQKNYRAESGLASTSARLRAILLSKYTEQEKLKLIREVIATLPSENVGPELLLGDDARSHAILTRTNGEAIRVLKTLFGSDANAPAKAVRLHAGSFSSLPPAWIGALLQKLKAAELTRSQFSKIYAVLGKQWDAATKRHLAVPSEADSWMRLAIAGGAPKDATSISIPDLRTRLGWHDSFPDDQSVHDDGIVITTIHQSKGMEFDVVTILDAPEESEVGNAANNWSEGEEANVGYVAITRAGRALQRMDPGQIHRPPTARDFPGGRERLHHWWNGWANIEMGLRGDIDPYGFVDPALHGTKGVEELQDFLLKNARKLEGQKLMLCKHREEGKAFWHVHLQDGTAPGRLIGRTAQQLTLDLLQVLHAKGYHLPSTIMNLRVASVGTVVADGEFTLEEPYRTSRMWLGVSIFGTGDFKIHKRQND